MASWNFCTVVITDAPLFTELAQVPALRACSGLVTRNVKGRGDLVVEVLAVGHYQQHGVGGGGKTPKLHGEKDHRERLTRALRVPDNAAAFRVLLALDALDGSVHRDELRVSSELLERASSVDFEDDEVSNKVEQVLLADHAPEEDVLRSRNAAEGSGELVERQRVSHLTPAETPTGRANSPVLRRLPERSEDDLSPVEQPGGTGVHEIALQPPGNGSSVRSPSNRPVDRRALAFNDRERMPLTKTTRSGTTVSLAPPHRYWRVNTNSLFLACQNLRNELSVALAVQY